MGHLCLVWAGLPIPDPILSPLCAKTVVWPYLGLHGSNRNSVGTYPRYKPPLLWLPHLRSAQTHSWTPILRPGCHGSLIVGYLGSLRAKMLSGRILRYMAQISIPRPLSPCTTPPPFVDSTPQHGPNAPLDLSVGSRLSIWPHCGRPNMGRTLGHFLPFRALLPTLNPILPTPNPIWAHCAPER